MKFKLISFLSLFVVLFLNPSSFAAQQNSNHKITSYVLLERDALNYLTTKLIPDIKNKKIHTDRLVLSFMDPSTDPNKIKADGDDLQKLLLDAGVLGKDIIQPNDGERLKNAILDLQKQNVQVLFAVGGWAYSSKNINKPQSNGTSNFPLTADMLQDFTNANLANDKFNQIQPVSNYSIKEYTDTWVSVAKAFGANGIDLDYEENWFVAETTYFYPQLTIDPFWASIPNGPFVIPYAVIKYARIIKSLEDSAQGLSITIAASAAGAFNIHDHIGGSMFWCPISDKDGNKLCGQPPVGDQSSLNIGGNMKGVLYDMAHYQDINNKTVKDKKYPFRYNDALFAGLLSGLDSINVMTYDLDDGYDNVGASWCIGTNMQEGTQQYTSRDPNTDGYKKVDCSIGLQTKAIIEMYRDNVLSNLSGNKPHLGFGLEAGFPNYPINIDPGLSGGGNNDRTDPHYRWNDPFVAAGTPLTQISKDDLTIVNKWLANHQVSDALPNVPDIHAGLLIVNQNLFNTMQTAGADSLILWSLNNADYNDHLSKTTSWDYSQFTQHQSVFGQYQNDLLKVIFDHGASPEDMLQVANQFYYSGVSKK